jgi:hypothetical protein
MAKKPRPPKIPPGPTRPVVFLWGAVSGATSYTLQVGTVSLGADIVNAPLGNVLASEVALPVGTYYSRVVAYQGATRISTTPQRTVVVA